MNEISKLHNLLKNMLNCTNTKVNIGLFNIIIITDTNTINTNKQSLLDLCVNLNERINLY